MKKVLLLSSLALLAIFGAYFIVTRGMAGAEALSAREEVRANDQAAPADEAPRDEKTIAPNSRGNGVSDVANAPAVGIGTSIGSIDAFEALEAAADAGDAPAMRNLAKFGRECQTELYVSTRPSAPALRPDGVPLSPWEQNVFATEMARKSAVCNAIGMERARMANNRMLDAALAGDPYARLNLRHFPPRVGSDGPHPIEEWKDAVVTSLESLGDDPKALFNLAEVHRLGLAGVSDAARSRELLQRVMVIAPPDSAIYLRAEIRLKQLKG